MRNPGQDALAHERASFLQAAYVAFVSFAADTGLLASPEGCPVTGVVAMDGTGYEGNASQEMRLLEALRARKLVEARPAGIERGHFDRGAWWTGARAAL